MSQILFIEGENSNVEGRQGQTHPCFPSTSLARHIVILLLVVMMLSACKSGGQKPQPRAVYLANGAGVLPESELQAHPEVLVVSSFEDFKAAAEVKAGLWIDKNAVDLLGADPKWLLQSPQKYYPLVLVGYNNPLYAFRDVMNGTGIDLGIEGPYVDWSQETVGPGYSVWMILEEQENGGHSSVFRGFPEEPTVENILAVTNELLPQSLAK